MAMGIDARALMTMQNAKQLSGMDCMEGAAMVEGQICGLDLVSFGCSFLHSNPVWSNMEELDKEEGTA